MSKNEIIKFTGIIVGFILVVADQWLIIGFILFMSWIANLIVQRNY
jgi:type IV secretory pathway TrbD component